MTRFADYQPDLHPAPLQDTWGRAWGAVHGAAKDAVVSLAREAMYVGGVVDPAGRGRQVPDGDLGRIGADTTIPRLPGEAVASYRARLAVAFDVWGSACTAGGLVARLDELAGAYGFDTYLFRTARDWSPTGALDATPDGRSDLWARWWALVFDPPWTLDTWDDGGTYDADATWDTNASAQTVSTVLAYLRQWSSARDLFYVRLYYGVADGDVWGPDTPWDSGTWGDESAVSIITWRLYE